MNETIVSVKRLFLDRTAIRTRVKRWELRFLRRFGATTRLIAQRSMRRTKRPSPPGRPPAVHKGLLRKHIYFAFDPKRDSVVIGPVKLSANSPVPALHEFGGARRYRSKTCRYPKRPYMNPAFEEAKKRIPSMLKETKL